MHEATLSGVFRLYRAALPRCWIPALVLALGGAATSFKLERMLPATADPWVWAEQVRQVAMTGAYWRILLAGAALSLLCYAALAAEILAVAEPGTPRPAAAGFGPAFNAWPSALVAAFIFIVVTTLGTLAFFVPGAWLWGMWQLWLPAQVAERLGPLDALRRSWRLMTGAWWRITTLLTVVFIVVFALALLGYLVAGGVLMVAGLSLGRATAVLSAMEALGNLLLAPLVTAGFVLAYLDRRHAQVPVH